MDTMPVPVCIWSQYAKLLTFRHLHVLKKSIYVEGVFIWKVSSVDMRMYVYPFPPLAGCGHESEFISSVKSVEVKVYPFSPPARCGTRGCLFYCQQYKCKDVPYLSTTRSVDARLYPFPQSLVWTWGCIPVYSKNSVDVGMFLTRRVYPFSTASTVDVRGVSFSIACGVDVQGVLYPLAALAVWTCKVYPSPLPVV